jgi:hypothetical protein
MCSLQSYRRPLLPGHPWFCGYFQESEVSSATLTANVVIDIFRALLLNLLRVVGRIFPEKYSSDLLTLPNLVELSTTGLSVWLGTLLGRLLVVLPFQFYRSNGAASATATYRASQILLSVSDVFTANLPPLPVHSQSRSRAAGFGAGSMGTGGAGTTGAGIGPSVSSVGTVSSSKFVPVSSVRTVRDLVLEMKASSTNEQAVQYSAPALSSKLALLQELNTKLHPNIDRLEFKKRMESSRVIGKEVRNLTETSITALCTAPGQRTLPVGLGHDQRYAKVQFL